jgi:hypothetical protein
MTVRGWLSLNQKWWHRGHGLGGRGSGGPALVRVHSRGEFLVFTLFVYSVADRHNGYHNNGQVLLVPKRFHYASALPCMIGRRKRQGEGTHQ